MRKRVCRGIFVLMMMILMTATAFAADTQRASDRFNSYTANLYVVSNGDLDINFEASVECVGRKIRYGQHLPERGASPS